MRGMRTAMALAGLVGIVPALASAQSYSPAELLKFNPTQKGVDYDTPADKAAVDACKVELVQNDQKRPIGYALRDGQGKMLRKFVNIRGQNNSLDQWSYYQDGFEVYREDDLNNDGHLDEARWLNMGGTRHGVVVKDRIADWKRISAEEASKVLVQALVSADMGLLGSVLASPEDLTALGVPKAEVDRVAGNLARRLEMVKVLRGTLVGWDGQTVWSRFDGTMPHVIPADTAAGLKGDLTLYENAVIFVGQPNGMGDPTKYAYLQAGEMLKVGDAWKFIDLPRAVDPNKPVLTQFDGGIRATLFRESASGPAQDPKLAEAIQALGTYDTQNAEALGAGDRKTLAQFYVGRIPLLRSVVTLTASPEEKLLYNKQIADSLALAYQTGLYPKGPELLDALVAEKGPIASYATYRKIMAENAVEAEQPGANPLALQKDLLAKLEGFLAAYGKGDEAPEVLLQLASFNEFNAEEERARTFYNRLATDFPETEAGKKAAGALKRLDLVGKPFDLKGPGLNGATIDAAAARGKTLLVTFWATWAEPAKRDLPDLIKLYNAKHKADGLEIIGVNLDNDRETLDAFLKANPTPWPQVFEPGGMDGRLADEYGIISLPTMILVDPQGKVINRNIRTAAELERQLEKTDVETTPATALGVR